MNISFIQGQKSDIIVNTRYKQMLSVDVLNALKIPVSFSDSVKIGKMRVSEKYDKTTAKNILEFIKIKNGFFSSFHVLKKSQSISAQPLRHNVIDINEQFAVDNKIFNNQIVCILFPSNFEMLECTIHINNRISNCFEMRLPTALKEHSDDTIVLLRSKLFICNTVKSQKATYVKNDIVTISSELYEELESLEPEIIEFRHIATGATIYRNFSAIICDDALSVDQIRLNYNQREMLNIVDSQKSSQISSFFSTLCDKVLRTNGCCDNYLEATDGKFSITDTYNQIQIVPSLKNKFKKTSILRCFCNLLVGSCKMNLSAVRPYKIDDSRDIVRLSEDIMTLLGLEETDRVILKYKNNICKASAMKIDTYDLMKETNIINSHTDLDLVVGIPAPIRKELGIGDIETEVTVERDTVFLFNKNINVQMLSVLGLFLAVFQIGEGNVLKKIIICVALLPIIIYASLSQERSKVKKYGKKRDKQ